MVKEIGDCWGGSGGGWQLSSRSYKHEGNKKKHELLCSPCKSTQTPVLNTEQPHFNALFLQYIGN